MEIEKLCVILGLHRSGSSCLAMVLQKLGIHMGEVLVGWEDQRGGGGEDLEVSTLCEAALPFPVTKPAMSEAAFFHQMRALISHKMMQAKAVNTIAGMKYPHLCNFAHVIERICGSENLYVFDLRRPLVHSQASLALRHPSIEPERLRSLQCWLWRRRDNFLRSTSAHVFTLNYEDLIERPHFTVHQIIRFLGVHPSAPQIADAISHPRKEHCHFR